MDLAALYVKYCLAQCTRVSAQEACFYKLWVYCAGGCILQLEAVAGECSTDLKRSQGSSISWFENVNRLADLERELEDILTSGLEVEGRSFLAQRTYF